MTEKAKKSTRNDLNGIIDNPPFSRDITVLDAVQRIERIKQAALWLDAHCMDVVSVEVEPISSSHAEITIEIRRLASLQGNELRVFAAMGAFQIACL